MMSSVPSRAVRSRVARPPAAAAMRAFGFLRFCFGSMLLVLPMAAMAAYPERRIRVIVAFPAGSAVDLLARAVVARLATGFEQPVVIENKVGASGNIGTELAARAPKDGYTLFFTASQLVASPGLSKVNYDPVKDFAPISLISRMPALLVVPADSPARTVADLIAMAKARPGALSYASGGNGSLGQFSGELLKSNGGNLDIVHIPYKSAAEQVLSVVSKQTSLSFPVMMLGLQYVKSGKLRALAVTGASRSEVLPLVPTMREAMNPGFALDLWFGLLAPAGVAPEIIDKLNAAIQAILRDPTVRGPLVEVSHTVVGSSPAEFAAVIQRDVHAWGNLARQLGVRVD